MEKFELLLKNVKKPARYIGNEYNTPNLFKTHNIEWCMCFLDLYEIAMSNQAIKILSNILNNREDTICDYCFAPDLDFSENLKKYDMQLMSLNLKKPIKDFDFLGFTLQYEMSYTNLLYMLSLAGIPFYSSDRDESYPIIVVGGPCAVNPEPIAPFVDVVCIGDGEFLIDEITNIYKDCKKKKFNKKEFFNIISKLDGVYVPSLVDVEYKNHKIESIKPNVKIKKSIIKSLDECTYPKKFIISNIETVHDRGVVEIFRGCSRGCRFCQAGFIYRPVRERSVQNIVDIASEQINQTGYRELNLSSLSTADYSKLKELVDMMNEKLNSKNIKLTLPSLRLDSFDADIISSLRKGSLTFAPEAGTQRLRDVINKNITQDDIFSSIQEAFLRGYSTLKLYFMIGLPTETMEDIMGIVNIARAVKMIYKNYHTSDKRLTLNLSTATFVPKPFTPFQWEAQIEEAEIIEKQQYLSKELRNIGVKYEYHDCHTSIIESVLARGNREIAKAIESVFRNGGVFDAWSEHFSFKRWLNAFEENGIDYKFFTGKRDENEFLPWDFIDIGVSKTYLLNERKKAYMVQTTRDCRKGCNGCGLTKMGVCNDII